jgi:hypothetical protein
VRAALSSEALDMLFLDARTHRAWRNTRPLTTYCASFMIESGWADQHELCPGRFVFIGSKEAKEQLAPAVYRPDYDRACNRDRGYRYEIPRTPAQVVAS